jgi:succinoglycan biosynthesis transport protein ExoP
MEKEQDAHLVPISNQSRQVQQFPVDEGVRRAASERIKSQPVV